MKHVFALTAFVLALLMHAAFVPAQDMATAR